MQNFGRGMWRRVGDYERLYVPEIIRSVQMQQYAAYLENNEKLKRRAEIDEYRKQMIAKINSNVVTSHEYANDNSSTDDLPINESCSAIEPENNVAIADPPIENISISPKNTNTNTKIKTKNKKSKK